MKDTSAQITGEQPVTSVSSAKQLIDSHNQVKAEIDARTDSIQKIKRSANKLVQQGHYAKAEVYIYIHAWCFSYTYVYLYVTFYRFKQI